jgi:hypothetical protein
LRNVKSADADGSMIDCFQPEDNSKSRGFSTPRRSYQA